MKMQIIDYIARNRVSSTEVADALGKTGAIPGVTAINQRHFRVGNVFWAYAWGGTNWHVHEQIQRAGQDDVVFIEVFDCGDKAIFGDLMAKYILLYRQARAIVVTGNVRDAHRLIKENWPIWCQGFNPIGCVNEDRAVSLDSALLEEHRRLYMGAVAVCDDTGVVIIPKDMHNQAFLERLHLIEEQEDQWYECIDRKKWSTFNTVCLKKYLMPPVDANSEKEKNG
jgi:regulator of RNase E activity RraA